MVKLAGYTLETDPKVKWRKRQQGVMACFAMLFFYFVGILGMTVMLFFQQKSYGIVALSTLLVCALAAFGLVKWQEPRSMPSGLKFPWRMLYAVPAWVVLEWVVAKLLIPANYRRTMDDDPGIQGFPLMFFPPAFIATAVLWNLRQQLYLLLAYIPRPVAPAGEHGSARLQGAADLAASGFVEEGQP